MANYENLSQDPMFQAYKGQMDLATSLHIAGRYREALDVRTEAHRYAVGVDYTNASEQLITDIEAAGLDPMFVSDLAGNVRNIGATHERLGDDINSTLAMQAALKLHESLDGEIENAAYLHREIAADQLYLCAFALKRALGRELASESAAEDGQEAVDFSRRSQKSFAQANQSDGAKHHQYELNALRRFSMTESLYGDHRAGRKLGFQALRWSVFSEPERKLSERSRAVAKAGIGATAALAVNMLTAVGARKLALKITQKIL